MFYAALGTAFVLGWIVYAILNKRIKVLEQSRTKLKYEYEDRILDILYDAKRIENKYATSGTEMSKYLSDKISEHSRKYYKYKNELNIAGNDNV